MQKISKKTYQSIKDRMERISEIGKTIKFDKESKRIFCDEFIDIIRSIDLEGRRIIFMTDEFSQAIENIIEDEGKRSAIHFLQTNRELRQDPQINQKIQWNIPFYFQLAVMEISNLLLDDEGETKSGKKRVTKKVIDHAFSRMLEHRNHFEHWEKRLRKAFKKEDYTFAKGKGIFRLVLK